ncbi:MAG: FAD-dependent oxidoreductase [Desulfovibrionales bacterium]|nr:FAD-dependent oxidoreductase [Desulfovibrionales bacterium]
MGQRLILAGGGHAHMMILAHIRNLVRNGHQVTVIQPSDYHYYSGMGPGMLGLTYTADDIRFATRHVVERQGGTFIRDKVTGIDAAGRTIATSSGLTLEYDVLSCNTGSFVPFQNVHGDTSTIFAVKPIERLQEAQRVVISLCASRSTPHIAVVGGGPAAVEIAGNLRRLANLRGRHMPRITLFAGRGLLSKLPAAIRSIARESLARQNIAINEEGYVQEIRNGRFAVGDSEVCPDLIFMATGVRPSPLFKASGLATGPSGGLLVNEYLHSVEHTEIFGGGDCIDFGPSPLDKVGVYAVRENPILLRNVTARLHGLRLIPFDPGSKYLLLFNMGDGTAIFSKGPVCFRNRSAFLLKDIIDRRFMRRFQALERL